MHTPHTIKYKSRNPIKNFFISQFRKELLYLIKSTQAKRVLDAGCGEGYLLDFINSKITDWHLECFDIDAEAVRKAQKKVSSAILSVRDIYDSRYMDKSFDLVINTEVLEHLEYPEKALAEIKRLTNRWVILSVPNEPLFSLSNLITGRNVRILGRNPGHINIWGESEFLNLVKNYFIVVRIVKPFPWLMLLCEIPSENKNEKNY